MRRELFKCVGVNLERILVGADRIVEGLAIATLALTSSAMPGA